MHMEKKSISELQSRRVILFYKKNILKTLETIAVLHYIIEYVQIILKSTYRVTNILAGNHPDDQTGFMSAYTIKDQQHMQN